VPTTPGRLAGASVLVVHGDDDTVIPRELLDRTWDYLRGESGAVATARREPGGHGLTPAALAALGDWVGELASRA
jgi:phospholipase/carboxylesterase